MPPVTINIQAYAATAPATTGGVPKSQAGPGTKSRKKRSRKIKGNKKDAISAHWAAQSAAVRLVQAQRH